MVVGDAGLNSSWSTDLDGDRMGRLGGCTGGGGIGGDLATAEGCSMVLSSFRSRLESSSSDSDPSVWDFISAGGGGGGGRADATVSYEQ